MTTPPRVPAREQDGTSNPEGLPTWQELTLEGNVPTELMHNLRDLEILTDDQISLREVKQRCDQLEEDIAKLTAAKADKLWRLVLLVVLGAVVVIQGCLHNETARTLERIKSQAVERGYAKPNPFRWEVGR